MHGWRLLELEARDGATNLAIDEAVATAVGAGESPPTLRLYTWSEPCLALGSFQPLADLSPAARAGRGPAVVRRASGGTLVLHDGGHLGFSLALPPGHPLAPADLIDAYRQLNRHVAAALHALGLPARLVSVQEARADGAHPLLKAACYGSLSPYEVVIGTRKLVGSAQLRRRGVVLHEGGILLRFDAAETAHWLAAATEAEAQRRACLLAARVTDLERELARPVTLAEVAAALVSAFTPALGGGPPAPRTLTAAERACAAHLRATKYAAAAWTQRR